MTDDAPPRIFVIDRRRTGFWAGLIVGADLNLAQTGVRTKTWTELSRDSEAFSVFDRAERAK